MIAADTQTKITVIEGLVRVSRDGSQIRRRKTAQLLVTTIEAMEPLIATPVKEPASVWKANLAKDGGEGEWISAAHAVRLEIGRAVKAGEIKEDDIPQAYGKRIADTLEDGGLLKSVPKPTGRADVPGNFVVSLNVLPRQDGPVLLTESDRLRIKRRVEKPAEVVFGLGAGNHEWTIRGRFITRRRVDFDFDIEIPFAEFRQPGRNDSISAAGLEAFSWFCVATDPGRKITHEELSAPYE